MAAALTRKRPSPLESRRARSWAAGIVYALGQVNFLSDDSREPRDHERTLREDRGEPEQRFE